MTYGKHVHVLHVHQIWVHENIRLWRQYVNPREHSEILEPEHKSFDVSFIDTFMADPRDLWGQVTAKNR